MCTCLLSEHKTSHSFTVQAAVKMTVGTNSMDQVSHAVKFSVITSILKMEATSVFETLLNVKHRTRRHGTKFNNMNYVNNLCFNYRKCSSYNQNNYCIVILQDVTNSLSPFTKIMFFWIIAV
jgi:hypothetical protein